jgi:tetratricopeptide (TPR) repeat protein
MASAQTLNDQFVQAQTAYAARDLDKALALVNAALEEEKEHAAAWKLRGDIHQRQGRLEDAAADYDKAVHFDAALPRLYVSRSAARISLGDLRGAQRDVDAALQADPKDADAWYNRACIAYLSENLNDAVDYTREAVKYDPQHAEAWFLSGTAKGELYREEEGVADVRKALAIKQDVQGGGMGLAILLYDMKRYAEAIAEFTNVLATDTSAAAEAYYYRGDSYYNLKDKEKACSDWRQAQTLGEEDAVFVVRNYCDTEATLVPKRPARKRRYGVVQF